MNVISSVDTQGLSCCEDVVPSFPNGGFICIISIQSVCVIHKVKLKMYDNKLHNNYYYNYDNNIILIIIIFSQWREKRNWCSITFTHSITIKQLTPFLLCMGNMPEQLI